MFESCRDRSRVQQGDQLDSAFWYHSFCWSELFGCKGVVKELEGTSGESARSVRALGQLQAGTFLLTSISTFQPPKL